MNREIKFKEGKNDTGDVILMQYVGAEDKKKTEIYEYDIVKVEGELEARYNGEDPFKIMEGPYIGVVTYKNFRFGVLDKENKFHNLYPEITTVIGNSNDKNMRIENDIE
jgi:uncharacterized phage protein (TIGR01671 family)